MLRRLAIVASLTFGATACSSSSATPATTISPVTASTMFTPAIGGSIKWKSCSVDSLDPLMCARFSVPYDYNKPDIGSFSLKLVKSPAKIRTKRIGSMLVNPGGPGFGGTSIAENASSYLSSDLIDTFDIIGWDPRGTGDSTPHVDCVDNYDKYFTADPSPQNDAERQAVIDISKAFADECQKKSGAILPYISTNATARDMDKIRAALGEQKITYFGFSYGSELGATWATLFPSTVRAAVLDGAADPTADYIEGGLQQAKGFETEFSKFLAQCSANKKCKFYNGGHAEAAFDELIQRLDTEPLLVSKNRALVNQAIAYSAVTFAMYSSSIWPDLEVALSDAQNGKGAGLMSLYDRYYQRAPDGKYGNELEAFNAIMCLDDPGPSTVAEQDSYIPQFKAAAPRLVDSFTSGYGCVFWSAKPDRRIAITGNGAGPIVVVGTTGDAATPLAGTRTMASTLQDGRLIVVTDDRHTGYGANDCVLSAVDKYLITTKVTFAEKAC
ncbi:MAG: alpha/beta fold hydrolase [Actinobacteria bacterium]|nr:alpha/beta fold hydrolase [Actinomycetota bacterium]